MACPAPSPCPYPPSVTDHSAFSGVSGSTSGLLGVWGVPVDVSVGECPDQIFGIFGPGVGTLVKFSQLRGYPGCGFCLGGSSLALVFLDREGVLWL